jgi:hypothetical protein
VCIILATAVTLTAVPTWIWVTMPRLTADAFIAAIDARDSARANKLLANSNCDLQSSADGTLTLGPQLRRPMAFPNAKIRCVARRWRDIMLGRQQMVIYCGEGNSGVKFYATWSSVTIPQGSGHLKL